MKSHIVIDGNAFYEVDEECMKRLQNEQSRTKNRQTAGSGAQQFSAGGPQKLSGSGVQQFPAGGQQQFPAGSVQNTMEADCLMGRKGRERG
ncbi:MAG: hypothetical protein Q4C50_04980 [Eubacteriales bacterium]|nr:hypothetical protein [Eubacteriales bacterium]